MTTARHPKAKLFAQRSLLSGVTTFAELEQRITNLPDEKSRGDAFEVFAEAYLATQRKHDAETVWPFASVPSDLLASFKLGTQDYGIDGVLKTLLGHHSAYQVKFRTGRPALTWREVSTFMGLADSPNIHSRILLTNCDALPSVMNERRGFFCIRGSDLDRLEADDFKAIEAWLADSNYQAPRKTPQPHQTEALEKILPAFKEHDRVSAIMACGTGKTLVALWVAEHIANVGGMTELGSVGLVTPCAPPVNEGVLVHPDGAHGVTRPTTAAKILVLLPSLALLRQTLHEWLRETSLPSLAYLCVCSDATVKEGLDALTTAQSDLDFEVSTNSASVRAFLNSSFAGTKIIFCTYQSATVVGEAMQAGEIFDLGIFDEAHKTAGREARNFAFALEDKNLPIRKRLFVTATPRHYNPLKKNKAGDAQLVFSMDKPETYGLQAYRLPFGEAAKRNIICRYKVVISVITSQQVTKELLSRSEVLVNGDSVRARQVANQIALVDAIAKYGVNKIFTFHSTVASAASFTSRGNEGVVTHLPEFKTLHVNGSMPTVSRERVMREFRECKRGIISNARCLTEGVDVPAVDMVAFLAPRRSRVDIVQATGRAMRRSPGKTTGYVLVPLYVELASGETVEVAVSRAEFDEIWDVLQSLQEQDDMLAEIIRAMREQKGKTKGFDDSRFRQRVEICGPSFTLEAIRNAITTECIERLGDLWDERFGELQQFKARSGHCNVPYGSAQYRQLAIWVSGQRSNRYRLTGERVRRLEAIGFIWDPFDSAWEKMFGALLDFHSEHGHCAVPMGWHRNQALSRWVVRQRQDEKKDQLAAERVEKLRGLGFLWDTRQTAWDQMLLKLKEFNHDQGHCNVSPRDQNNYELGRWVAKQRARRGNLSDEQTRILEKLEFNWDLREETWEQMFAALMKHKLKHGDCNVPRSYKSNQKLARWVHAQRSRRRTLNPQCVMRLNELGFVWDPKKAGWEARFNELIAFKRKHGHCKVPQRSPDYRALATWVLVQRSRRKQLDKARLQKLNRVGFVWDPFATVWEDMFAQLKNFKRVHGHCRVSSKSREFHHLAMWVNVQRSAQRKGSIEEERASRLTKIGFDWDPLESYWEGMFEELVKFKGKHRNCDVPAKWAGNRPLGGWVSTQRQLKKNGKMSKHHFRRLNAIGFRWTIRGNGKTQLKRN